MCLVTGMGLAENITITFNCGSGNTSNEFSDKTSYNKTKQGVEVAFSQIQDIETDAVRLPGSATITIKSSSDKISSIRITNNSDKTDDFTYNTDVAESNNIKLSCNWKSATECIVGNTTSSNIRIKTITVILSDDGNITTNEKPTFTKVSASPKSVKTNETITLTAESTGIPNEITYTWYKNGTTEAIGTGATVETTEATAGTYTYYCIAKNSAGETISDNTTVEVTEDETDYSGYTPKTISPTEETRNPGGNVKLTMESIGGGSQSFKWFVSETNEYKGTLISDAPNNRQYSFYAPTTPGIYYYYCEGHSNNGKFISGIAKIIVNEATGTTIKITKAIEPLTETQVGKIVALNIATNGSKPKYQWYSNSTSSNTGGTAISGATTSTYSFTAKEIGTSYYYCIVTCTEGTLTSSVATVIVSNIIQPTLDATRFTIQAGQTHALNVVATANGTDITKELKFTYTSDNVNIATVDVNGIVTGIKEGTTNIRFSSEKVDGKYEYAEGEAIVTVTTQETFIPVVKYTAKPGSDDSGYDIPATEDEAYKGNALSISLEPETEISDNYEIYYTEDGSNPTTSSGKKYDPAQPIKITQTTFLKAVIKMTSGKNKGKYGEIVERTYRFDFTLIKSLGNNQQIEPGVGYDISEGDRTYIITTYGSEGDTEGLDSGKTSLWDKGTKDNEMNNSYISGFNYHALGNKDAGGEKYKYDESKGYNVYEKYDGANPDNTTFDIPINGAYIKFEPKMDGQINMIVRQNGLIANQKNPDYTKVRKRYAYVCDETGKAMTKDDGFTAMISTNSIIEKRIFNFGYKSNLDDDVFTKNLKDIKDVLFNAQTDEIKTTYNADGFWEECYKNYTQADKKSYIRNILSYDEDGKGYYVIDKAYVRYSFPVKAGKTYFLMGNWTKLAPCGYSFKRDYRVNTEWDEFVKDRKITIEGEKATTELPKGLETKGACTITLNRKFTAGGWTSLVLPFSVSPTEVINTFGEGTEIVHFNKVEGETLFLTKHFHQMIVAGTPVLIRPTKTLETATIIGTYQYETEINPMVDYNSGWKMTGSYTSTTVPAKSYMMGYNATTGESSIRYIPKDMNINGTRAWLVNETSSDAKLIRMNMNGIEDHETTSIDNILSETLSANHIVNGVYNLNGQMIRNNGSTTGLAAGIYIINGKKIVVK